MKIETIFTESELRSLSGFKFRLIQTSDIDPIRRAWAGQIVTVNESRIHPGSLVLFNEAYNPVCLSRKMKSEIDIKKFNSKNKLRLKMREIEVTARAAAKKLPFDTLHPEYPIMIELSD